MEFDSRKTVFDGLGSYKKPVVVWHPASPNHKSGRYVDWDAQALVYDSAELRERTTRQHAALLALLNALQIPCVDRTGDLPFGDIAEFLTVFRVPCPLVLIWDEFNVNDAFTLDGATSIERDNGLISVTFDDEANPSYGFGKGMINLSKWDGNPDSAEVQRLVREIKNAADYHDIFVSYARADAPLAEKICVQLGKLRWNTWWDAALKGGDTFAEIIERKLAEVKAVVVLWTASSTKSNWVLDEAAIGRDRRVLVPVRFENVKLPLGFGQIHSIQCRGQTDGDIKALCDEITSRVLKLPTLRNARSD
ncbi:toll/interleukin-1 receptor domain-containing protein [Bradyrhizobium tropiciagri]|uniref:toll/interleukin-1 receptor domain-containing protein n=1 Tax=Bradyrhizobium tropiciagri TaxID=312253 RepID=UPI001BA91F48|nr:toll/interleukin-1 receptor domain-containing protein [Bradyrhizobium tropiciagri]MBR0899962.1 toll/interleukin-1 receptor domain-containing protein [Bradyrhizobium tropiciagri]